MAPWCSEWLYLLFLKVDVQFLIMTFLSPADICRLGATSRYWRAMVRDPLLWRYFLFRDMPYWTSIDHLSMPQMDTPVIQEDESLDDREEGSDTGLDLKFDYMSEWVLFSVMVTQQFKKKLPSNCILWGVFVVFFLNQQIPEGVPVLQTAMASFTPCIWGCHLISAVPGALPWATLCDVWPWNGRAGRLFCREAFALPWHAPDIWRFAQTDNWWGCLWSTCL